MCITEGRKTFPRARRTQGNSFRSPVSFSPTEHSLSTSSGSSVFTPEYEDNRMRRRGSDIDNPTLSVMDISPPSRCEFWPFVNPAVKLLLFKCVMSKPSTSSKHKPLNVFISLIGKGQDYARQYLVAYLANLHVDFQLEFTAVITKHCKSDFLDSLGPEKGFVGRSYYLFLQMLVMFSFKLYIFSGTASYLWWNFRSKYTL